MGFQVRLADNAQEDVERVLRWFRDESALAAGEKWLSRVMTKIKSLETQPKRCKLAAESDELGLEIREMTIGRRRGTYRILFIIRERDVVILRVRGGAQDAVPLETLRDPGNSSTLADN